MIDIHTHILPGIDDGARSMDDTVEMAWIAVENGTTDLIATPHCNIPGHYENFFDSAYRRLFEAIRQVLERERVPLRLYPGMEVYATEELPRLFEEGLLLTLNGGHYLLMEFDFCAEPEFADRILAQMQKLGVIPVIAHIERYRFVQARPELAARWRNRGCVIQCNKGSFQGRFGSEEQRLAYWLMDQRLVDVIASDAHRPYMRTPSLGAVRDQLSMDYPETYLRRLFRENARCILRDQPIPRDR